MRCAVANSVTWLAVSNDGVIRERGNFCMSASVYIPY